MLKYREIMHTCCENIKGFGGGMAWNTCKQCSGVTSSLNVDTNQFMRSLLTYINKKFLNTIEETTFK